MTVNPVTITTDHDATSFDPETHRGPAAEQLGLDPDAIHCTATGPDDFTVVQEGEYSQPVFSQDGTVIKPAEQIKPRIVQYHRRTTWEPRPTVARVKEAPRAAPKENHAQPRLPRGAKWHGIVDGKEGNYISDGAFLHHVDSDAGKALAADMAKEAGSGSVPVGK